MTPHHTLWRSLPCISTKTKCSGFSIQHLYNSERSWRWKAFLRMTATSSKQQPPSSWPILSMPSQCSQTCKTRERFAQNWSQKSPPSSLPLRPSYCSQSCRQSGDLLRIGDTQPHIKIRQPLTPFPFHRPPKKSEVQAVKTLTPGQIEK